MGHITSIGILLAELQLVSCSVAVWLIQKVYLKVRLA
jgi:hypothetical protein